MTTNDDDRARVGGVDVASLRAAAEAATSGGWVSIGSSTSGQEWGHKPGSSATCIARDRDDMSLRVECSAFGRDSVTDAAYIAAASPDAVLALLDEVEALREMLSAAQELIAGTLHVHSVYSGMRAKNRDVRLGADAVLSALMAVMTDETPTDPAPTAQVGAEGRGEGL